MTTEDGTVSLRQFTKSDGKKTKQNKNKTQTKRNISSFILFMFFFVSKLL